MHRRTLLVAALGLLGGCLGGDAPVATTTTETASTTTNPTGAPAGVPVPGEDCAVTTLPEGEYPSLPTSLTEATGETFAIDFEKAYATAELEADEDVSVSGFDGWNARVVERFDSGLLLTASVQVDFGESGDGTRTMLGSSPSHGWYYVTERFAARAPGAEYAEEPPTYTWEIVACG
ncbi:hypothetical protein [Haloarchaeobius sp. TZWSO28]|uniref:hypothetical protein n=1 Tax=Haloarchaeobius sp. TZWSO28 TaxID=3446119 RepID=UPI003EBDAFF5